MGSVASPGGAPRGGALRRVALALLLALAAALPAAAGPVRFAVLSDTHVLRRDGAVDPYPATVRTVTRIVREIRPAFVVHAGDLMSLNRGDDEARARAHMEVARRSLLDPLDRAGIPFLPTPGNHDKIAAGSEVYAEAFAARSIPAPLLWGDSLAGDYAVRHRNVILASVDGSRGAWRQGALAQVAALLAREKRGGDVAVVVTHVGLAPSKRHPKERLRNVTADDLVRAGVDVLLCGHQHAFSLERLGKLLHVTCGSSGETRPSRWLLVTVDGTDVRVEAREGD